MTSANGFEAQFALVTGAATGLGEASAHEPARRRVRVGVMNINAEGAACVADAIKAEGGEVWPCVTDGYGG